jgi:hypothetical protein
MRKSNVELNELNETGLLLTIHESASVRKQRPFKNDASNLSSS